MGTSNIPKEESEKRSGCTDTDVDFSSKHIPDYTISDNINGLSCFYPSNGPKSDDECAYICNPSTRDIIILPPSPMGSDVSYSFGVDPFTNIFKVLGIHKNLLFDPSRAEISIKLKTTFYTISSHSRSWRQIHPVLPSDIDDRVLSNMDGKGICVNGMIHWMLASKMTILTFCLRDEKFGLMPLPKEVIPPVNDFRSKGLIQIGGCLAFTPIEWTSFTKQLWILKDHKNQVWVKKSITVPYSDWTYGIFPYLISSVHIDKLFFRRPGFDHVVCYDMKTKTFTRFQLAQLPKGYEITDVTTYLESLLEMTGQVQTG